MYTGAHIRLISRFCATLVILALLWAAFPATTFAADFGGRVSTVLPCFFTGSWYTIVGAPKGGAYIWTPSTKTYSYGRPSAGKWVLGLSGGPFICLISPLPVITIIAPSMYMMGSSQ